MLRRPRRSHAVRHLALALVPAIAIALAGGIGTAMVAADRADTARHEVRDEQVAKARAVADDIDRTIGERLAQVDIAASVIEATWPMGADDFERFIASYRLGTSFTDMSLSIVVESVDPADFAAVQAREAASIPGFRLAASPGGSGPHAILMRTPRGEQLTERSLIGLDLTTMLPQMGFDAEDLAREGMWLRPIGRARPILEQVVGDQRLAESATLRSFTSTEVLAVQRMVAPDRGATIGWFIVPIHLSDLVAGRADAGFATEVQLLDRTGAPAFEMRSGPDVGLAPLVTSDVDARGVPWRILVHPTHVVALPPRLDRGVLVRGLAVTLSLALLAGTWIVLRRRQRRLVRELDEASRLAVSDFLTGLYNRSGLERCLDDALRGEARGPVFVLLLDADRFKLVNDNEGHQVGDDVLRSAAARLREVVGDAGSLARFGGDEFVVVATRLSHVDDAVALAHRIHEDFERPLVLGEGEHLLSVSIGIAEATPDERVTGGVMLSRADMAMYTAKRGSGARTAVFDRTMQAEAARQLDVERDLRAALREGRIVPYFQPIFTPDRRLVAFEALARWEHPERGVLLPAEFLDVASQAGCMPELNRQILRRACELGVAWNERRAEPVRILVNLAEELLLAPAFHADVAAVLAQTGLAPELLTLEINEDTALSRLSPDLHELRRLSDLGIRLAIDDFGRGRSSLLALSDLDMVTVLKLDRAFVQKLPRHEPTRTVFLAVREIARGFGMHLVAEGVETEEEAERLVALGVDFVQGYLYGRPAPAHEAARLLDAPAGAPSGQDVAGSLRSPRAGAGSSTSR